MNEKICKTELLLKSNLRLLREGHGFTAYALCKDMAEKGFDIQLSYYYKLENPQIHLQPRLEKLEKIATYYNIEVYELFKET